MRRLPAMDDRVPGGGGARPLAGRRPRTGRSAPAGNIPRRAENTTEPFGESETSY